MQIIEYFANLQFNQNLAFISFLISVVFLLIVSILVRDRTTFTKDGELISEKPKFYSKFLGVLLILSITFAANNAFVYVISTFIIATLVTELQFLEMLIALIWNRPEYVKGRFGALNKQHEETETKKRLEEIEKLAKNSDELLKAETLKSNQFLLFYHFERVYRLIFGSQIKILLDAENNGGKIDLMSAILIYKMSGWDLRGYDAGNYTKFLLDMGLVAYTTGARQEDCFYTLTQVGKMFLQYLRENNITTNKPF